MMIRDQEQLDPKESILDGRARKVLVVDDDLPLRGMLSSVLRRHGFQVFLAGDGGEALRALMLHQPHVVLLDLMMPGINGWDFLENLKSSGQRVPVIVISAHLRNEPQAVLALGASAILPKPFNLEELLDVIQHVASA